MASISSEKASEIAKRVFHITSEATALPGDLDQNFKLVTPQGDSYLLKIITPETAPEFLDFQEQLLQHLSAKDIKIQLPTIVGTEQWEQQSVRLFTWVSGRLWASVHPKTPTLRTRLGIHSGALTAALADFDHPTAHRHFDWNLTNAQWTKAHVGRFSEDRRKWVSYFQDRFLAMQPQYAALPQSVVHNDINDYNILVSHDLIKPEVTGIIDFGDAVYTQTVNDLAVVITYAIMDLPDPLQAAMEVVAGYHRQYPLSEAELQCLYVLVGMRLVISVTKSSLRGAADPSNLYHVISEKPAWDLMEKWYALSEEFAYYCFRSSCDLPVHPGLANFNAWISSRSFSFSDLFPSEAKEKALLLDLKVSSNWMGSQEEFNNLDLFQYRIDQLQKEHPNALIAGGYCEPRPLYTASSYDKEGNSGPESRTVHLGIDFWLPAGTQVNALLDGEIVTVTNDVGFKEYGGLIIIKHELKEVIFYSLYGHLSQSSLSLWNEGDSIAKGDCIGWLGNTEENGAWAPHLHFQIMLSMLNYTDDFPGVTYKAQLPIWKGLCPDPNLLFKDPNLVTQYSTPQEELKHFRSEHLGKSLSLSYETPLHIVRGQGPYLIDVWGRKYLDTANNVNHVGHQHPKVVETGQRQMSILNTNTRYLHEEIVHYAEALLKKLPKELSVLHFVNSGSEANELAIRMAKACTGGQDLLAIEVGYHGNTNAVIDVSSYKFDGKGGSGKPESTHILPLPDPFRGRHTDADCGMHYAEYAKTILDQLKTEGKRVAGFIGESMISCGGQIVPPNNYFKKVYHYVREAGGICIADEVQTGFGRMGKTFWAFELYDVLPDIVTMGKPAGNGHPLAVVACTREVADRFDTGMEFFNTFGGNPVSCAIGRTLLEVIEEENLQQNALETGDFLKNELIALQKEYSIIGDVRGEGLFLGFELTNSEKEPLAQHATYLANRMKDLGILMSTDGPDYNVLKIKPPMVFTKDHAKELIFRLRSVLSEDFMKHYCI
ncbi:aminotransferase class III-fold pyridoxal phosphate-dependent enzyme [Altibacter sp.]|uniref:aminotransferase class III-fold pyridoxal phosphate-dependent enzyme n=1 Tax=Altibacter sp. TaxID=2024823 RepID=UPI000C961A00|nr:aminotransferase class III-fold pyridoxal phosphate-dependent enzyme [Altibacter sp.]MAP55341.1 peptidase M23 [Altibacter sp.]